MPAMNEALAHCRRIAATDKPNLFLVSGALAKARRPFFYAAYAAMRLADDLADTELERFRTDAPARDAGLAGLERWARRVEDALAGRWEPLDEHDPVFQALAESADGAGRSPGPWLALRTSMAWDIVWRPIATWEDFEEYCQGACIAPAAIFYYLLGGTAMERRLEGGDIMDLGRYCADLAVFCYLVHGLRDLAKDAARSKRLIVFPDELVARHFTDKQALVEAVMAGRLDAVLPLVGEIIERALSRLAQARLALAEGRHLIGIKGRVGLDVLTGLYSAHLERMQADFRPYLEGRNDIDPTVRDRLMAPLGAVS